MKTAKTCGQLMIACAIGVFASVAKPATGLTYDLVNGSFEDISGQTEFNEFTFGIPLGWELHDPFNIEPDAGTYIGTLSPNGVDFFSGPAPAGQRVAILFNSGREGEGEYGIRQTLSDTLQANTRYELSVDVGNIASGTAQNGEFFNLDEFPGYRIELRAGGALLAEDENSLTISEGTFARSTLSFITGSDHTQLGEALEVRLINLNQLPAGYSQATSPDLEVDFDDVRFTASAVPEPNPLALSALAGMALAVWCLRFSRKRLQVSPENGATLD